MRRALCLLSVAAQALAQSPSPYRVSSDPAVAVQPAPSRTLQAVEDNPTMPGTERANLALRRSILDFLAPYRKPTASPLPLGPAERARSLVRDAKIYLSLYDALALAIENNLDVEVGRYNLAISGADLLRARGGGNLRGIDYSVAESPTGVGGPGSPLLNAAASTVTPTTPTVNDLTSLNVLTQTQTDLSVQGAAPFSSGPDIPAFDPSFIGQTAWFHRGNAPLLTSVGAPASAQTVNFTAANYSLIQGFSSGAQLEVDLNNAPQVLYGSQSNYNPFSQPNTAVTLTQPLLRGSRRDVNLRFLRIAALDQKISRLVFYQQLISTVYGVARLYYDLVSLNENAQVQRETLAAARKLFEDDAAQVDQGTLAPLELTRAQSLVTSSQLDLIQAEGLVHQQEVILKSQLARRGSADPVIANLPIVPTDPISIPPGDELEPVDKMVAEALSTRPDLVQAGLQVQTGELAVKASQNQARPEVDVIGNFQTRGSTEAPFAVLGTTGTGLLNAPNTLSSAGLRTSRVYEAGIQLNLPLRNRVAQADAARDLLQLRQAQARTQQLANEVREDVENSVIALETARSALAAAIESRKYQEQLVSAEKDKLSVGASTNFLVVQQESYLAQARSTEVAARSVWIKARIALDRAIGDLLERNGITYDDSVLGQLPAAPPAGAHENH
jgi:outer membrane protein